MFAVCVGAWDIQAGCSAWDCPLNVRLVDVDVRLDEPLRMEKRASSAAKARAAAAAAASQSKSKSLSKSKSKSRSISLSK